MNQIEDSEYVREMGIVTSEGRDHIGLYPAKQTSSEDAKDTRPLVYILTIREGQGELAVDIDHPLARPIREPAVRGAPGTPWQYVGIRHSGEVSPTVVGAFVRSLTGKLLFFPAGDFRFTDAEHLGRFSGKPVDHFTLDPPRGAKWTSHTTLKDGARRERHGLRNTATQRDGEMLHWLSILTPNVAGFLSLPRTLTLPLKRAKSDVLRYTQDSIGTNYRSRALVDAPAAGPDSFWQIDFQVGMGPKWRDLKHRPATYEGVDDLMRYDALGEPRTAGVCFSELVPEFGLAMIVTRPKGWCREPCFVTPPDDWRVEEK
jgi:hypothetical protein